LDPWSSDGPVNIFYYTFPNNADLDSGKLLFLQGPDDGLEPIMAFRAASFLDLHLADAVVEVIMDNNQSNGIADLRDWMQLLPPHTLHAL
jgi:hypothetical protein